MATHIRLFQNETEFNSAIASEYVEPWLSYTEGNGVNYNKQQAKINGYNYIDLGLPSGTLWAECNVGATSKEELGDSLRWGQINVRPNKDDLKLENDAVYINMGGEWHTPSSTQIAELIAYTTTEGDIINDKKGVWAISIINGNRIFLPVENDETAIYFSKTFHEWDSGSQVIFGLGVYYYDAAESELDYDDDCTTAYPCYFRGVVG